MAGSIAKAEEIVASDPERYVLLQQFKNPANPEIHFRTTGPEIWEDTDGTIDVLVSGIGTGGTISGVSRYIKKDQGQEDSFGGRRAGDQSGDHPAPGGQAAAPGPHKIQGIGAGFIPDTLDLSMVDRVELVTNEESIEMARRLAKEEGILARHLLRRGRGRGGAAGASCRSSRARRS